MGLGLALLLVGAPYVYYRQSYEHARRLRPVTEGRLYRSGCMTADGFREAVAKYQIRTVLNLMEESPDPTLRTSYFDRTAVSESELLRSLNVKMVNLTVDLLPEGRAGKDEPAAVDAFRKVMDDPANWPVLIHCKAGLHRTGVMVAVYRMEYEGWTRHEALRELKSHGFGEFASSSSNDYIQQYVMTYQPRAVGSKQKAVGRDESHAVSLPADH
jgi:protein-tyrosine phosphatase